MIVGVSGAQGFVGRHLLSKLTAKGVSTIPIVRPGKPASGNEIACDLDSPLDLALPPITHFVHLAARVHVMNETEPNPEAAFRRTNVQGTHKMLKAAHAAGVRRFVFISSIKVLGEETKIDEPYRQNSLPAPVDAYGRSKLEAEQLVRSFCAEHGFEWLIVRPVLIYGPGVSANFAQLFRIVERGWPLPFGAIRNRRSLLALENLCSFLVHALDAPALNNRTINLADSPAFTTGELVAAIGAATGQRPPMIPVPARLLEIAGVLTGKGAMVQRLTRSLEVDTEGLFQELNWAPPQTTSEALREVAAHVRQSL